MLLNIIKYGMEYWVVVGRCKLMYVMEWNISSNPWSKYKRREPIPMSGYYTIEARRWSLSGQPKWPPMKSKDSHCVITHVYVCYFFTEQCDCHDNEF